MTKMKMREYSNLISNDDDMKLDFYAKLVRQSVPVQIDEYMATTKDKKFFSCEQIKTLVYFSDCDHVWCGTNCNTDRKQEKKPRDPGPDLPQDAEERWDGDWRNTQNQLHLYRSRGLLQGHL